MHPVLDKSALIIELFEDFQAKVQKKLKIKPLVLYSRNLLCYFKDFLLDGNEFIYITAYKKIKIVNC